MTLDPIAMATRGYVCGPGPDPISIATYGYVCVLVAVEEGRFGDPATKRRPEPFDLGYYKTKYGPRLRREQLVTVAEAEQIVTELQAQAPDFQADLESIEGEIAIYLDAQALDKIVVGGVAQQLADLEAARDMVLQARKQQNDEVAAIVAVIQMYYH